MSWQFLFSIISIFAWADEAPLDPPYGRANPVLEIKRFFPLGRHFVLDNNSRSDLEFLVGRQTPVKSQGGRGTCSIFSATGALESLLKIRSDADFDLSENYLEYLVMNYLKANNPTEGSDTPWNFTAFRKYGTILEERWPYEEHDWSKPDLPSAEVQRRDTTCGDLRGRRRRICILSHRRPGVDPDALAARTFHGEYQLASLYYQAINEKRVIDQILDSGHPLILSIEFFYGAWNHRLMEEYGIGQRDMDAWKNGRVGIPNSNDVALSRIHPAGHSIIIVGYDNERRVYYFKNSWGTTSFGSEVDFLEGKQPTIGYGTIEFDYAHSFGTFYRVGS